MDSDCFPKGFQIVHHFLKRAETRKIEAALAHFMSRTLDQSIHEIQLSLMDSPYWNSLI